METIENVCRICLGVDAKINLFDEENAKSSYSLLHKFTICTQVQVTMDDSLSKLICEDCCFKVNDAFQLRITAQEADKALRERLGLVKTEIKVDSSETDAKDELIINEKYLIPKIKKQIKNPKSKSITKIRKIDRKSGVRRKGKNRNKSDEVVAMNSKDFISNLHAHDLLEDCEGNEYLDDKCNVAMNDENCAALCENIDDKLNLFIKTEVKTNLNSLVCTLCDIVFKHTNVYKRHMRVNHRLKGFDRAKDYMCDTCGNTFHDQYGLEMHKRSHTGDRPFTCNECGQGFTQQSNMERHILAKHKKVKPFQCEICSKHFAYSSSLREHKQGHGGQKNYQCSICNRRFGRNYTLARHQLTHTHARPYVCKHCNRSYTQSNDLKTHVKKIHPNQPTDKLSDFCNKQVVEINN